jgi:hypothetical protein
MRDRLAEAVRETEERLEKLREMQAKLESYKTGDPVDDLYVH